MELIKNNVQIPERNACLDYARIIAVLLVIYGHLYDPNPDNFVRVFIYQFHMPFFFFVSGMLHKYNGTIQFKKYAKTLLIPVIFFCLLCFVFKGLAYHLGTEFDEKNYTVKGDGLFETYMNYLFYMIPKTISGTGLFHGPSWFLIALYYCKIYHDFLCRHFKIGFVLWCVFFVCLCYNRHRELYFANAVVAIPYYYIGYQSKRWLDYLNDYHKSLVLALMTFCIVFFFAKYNGIVSSYGIIFSRPYPRYVGIPIFYMTGFAGSIMMLSLASFLGKSTKISSYLGNALISFIGFHSLFCFAIEKTIGINQDFIISIWIALAIFVACIPLHWVVMRCAPCLLGKYNNK